MDALQRTLADVVFPVRLILTVTFLQNLAFRWDVLLTTPAINVSLATPILVPVFPADLMPIVPVALVTATPGITSRVLPVLKTRYILTATLAHQGTAAQTLGEVRLRRRPRPVLAVLLREPVTKPRRTPTATAVPADISLQAVHPLRFRPGQLPRFALAALLPAPAISARVALSQTNVLATSLLAVTMAL